MKKLWEKGCSRGRSSSLETNIMDRLKLNRKRGGSRDYLKTPDFQDMYLHAESNTFISPVGYIIVLECQRKKTVGKPYAEKLHVRFDVAGDGNQTLTAILPGSRLSYSIELNIRDIF